MSASTIASWDRMDPAPSPAERRISVRRLSELPDFRANPARDVRQGLGLGTLYQHNIGNNRQAQS